jgi:hypothetical protein
VRLPRPPTAWGGLLTLRPERRQGARVEELEALLRRQGGLARRRDVLRTGLSRRGLDRLVRQGRLRLLTPHLVTDVDQPSPDEPLRALAVGLQATVSHTSAAILWGMELATTPVGLTVTVERNRSRVVRAEARVHRQDLSADDRVHRDGLELTTPLRTVLDLCRSLPLPEAVAVADSALRRGLVTVEELAGAARALPPAVGRGRVAAVVRLVDPWSGSVLESLFRVLLHLAGLPAPETQLGVRGAGGRWIGRVDFAWPSAGSWSRPTASPSTPTARATAPTGGAATRWCWPAGGCCASAGRTWWARRRRSWRWCARRWRSTPRRPSDRCVPSGPCRTQPDPPTDRATLSGLASSGVRAGVVCGRVRCAPRAPPGRPSDRCGPSGPCRTQPDPPTDRATLSGLASSGVRTGVVCGRVRCAPRAHRRRPDRCVTVPHTA